MAWLYILECADGSYYVGSTRDLDTRVNQHNAGEGCAHTAKRRPVRVVYAQEFDSVVEAFYAEREVHGWSRAKKKALIEGRCELLPELSKRQGRYQPKPA